MSDDRQQASAGSPERDPVVMRRCPTILPLLDPHGLTARWIDAEDESVDDEVDVRLEGSDEELGGIQYCGEGVWMANAWTSAQREAMAHGLPRTDPAVAAADLVGLLERHNRIAAQ